MAYAKAWHLGSQAHPAREPIDDAVFLFRIVHHVVVGALKPLHGSLEDWTKIASSDAFQPSPDGFAGARKGYVFKQGESGLGYYASMASTELRPFY